MSKYELYGSVLIEDDSTMRNFALSVIKNIPEDDLQESKARYYSDLDDAEYEDIFMGRVRECLIDDIPRTDINYPELMSKYSREVGDILFDIENHGTDLSTLTISFFGEKAKQSFNKLIEEYVWIMKFGGSFSCLNKCG